MAGVRPQRDANRRQLFLAQTAVEPLQAGKLKSQETVVVGIDQAVEAFLGLFTGKNVGKMVVQLDK